MHAAEQKKRARTANKATSRRDHHCSPLTPLLQAAADRTIMLRRTSKRVKELHDRAVSPIHQLPVQLTYPSPDPLPPPEHLQLRVTPQQVSLNVAFCVSQVSGPFLGGCCDRSAISPEEQEKFLQGPPGETQEEWHKQPAFMYRYRSITIFHRPINFERKMPKRLYIWYWCKRPFCKQRAQENANM